MLFIHFEVRAQRSSSAPEVRMKILSRTFLPIKGRVILPSFFHVWARKSGVGSQVGMGMDEVSMHSKWHVICPVFPSMGPVKVVWDQSSHSSVVVIGFNTALRPRQSIRNTRLCTLSSIAGTVVALVMAVAIWRQMIQ